MKSTLTLMLAALLSVPTFAASSDAYDGVAPLSAKRLSGSLTIGAATNYVGRGYVPTNTALEGESIGLGAVQLGYDFGREGYWSYTGTIAYKVPFSGHTLYGNPKIAPNVFLANVAGNPALMGLPTGAAMAAINGNPALKAAYNSPRGHIGEKNIENEFAVINGLKYTREKWNVSFGHQFTHGGLLGVMAKHYRKQGSSHVNELYLTPEFTPYKWMTLGMTVRNSFDGIQGWWFEPYARFQAPIIGTPEDITVAGQLEFGASATANYFQKGHEACANGVQAVWVKFSAPWFVTDSLILTPSVSCNWAGPGAQAGNERSKARWATQNSLYVPFQNFAVVGQLTATYKF